MPHTQLKFENFIYLMEKNWPSAHQSLFVLFPRIERIATNIEDQIAKLMDKRGLLASDFHLLTAIRRTKSSAPFEVKPSELCNYMLFSWGGLAKVMKRLESKGIITRVNCEQDKRISLIRLTDKGVNIVNESVLDLQKVQQKLLIGFKEEELNVLDKLLGKLINNIELPENNKSIN